MNFLRTILTATAVCAAMLAAAIHLAGDLPEPDAYAGLTTADILASDGTPPGDAAWFGAKRDRPARDRLAVEASHPASEAPGGGARG